MKKIAFFLSLLPIFAFAQNIKQFTITGNVTGLADGEVKITTTQNDHATVASGTSQNGVFTVTGSVPEPGLYFLVMSNEQPQYVYLENVPIKITGNKENIKAVKIEGSQSHNDFVEFNRIFTPIMGELNAAAAQLNKETEQSRREFFYHQYDSIANVLSREVTNFVSSKRSSYVSPFLLWVTAQVTPNIMVMESNYNMLDENIRNNTQIGKSLGEYIATNKVGAIGTEAVDFTQNDTSGKAVTLSSFKGKYVLVDFWASWCRPCRMENPNVVKAYDRFKDKNFTIIGVSLDQHKDPWVAAIKKDNLTWNHVSDLQYWSNAVAQLYKIQSIPGNFLVDPTGKIIAKDLHGEDLERTLEQYLGSGDQPVKGKQDTKTESKSKSSKQIKKTPPNM